MRRLVGLLTLTALAVPASAGASPPGNGLVAEGPFDCDGAPTTIVHSQGGSAYIGDQHYVVASFAFSGGGDTDTKTFGAKAGLPGALTCSEALPEGTFTVVLVPVPPRGG